MARKETPTRKIDKLVEERMKESGRIGVAESKKAGKKRKRFKMVRDKSGRLRVAFGKKRSRAPMPSGNTYRIRRGDTLSGIAKRLGTTVSKLMAMNPQIKDKNKIRAGAMLNIRGTKPSARSKAAKSFVKAMKEGEKAGKEIKKSVDKKLETIEMPTETITVKSKTRKKAGKTPKVKTKGRGLSYPAGGGTQPRTREERERDIANRARISKEKGRGGASRSMLDRFKDMMRGR